MSEDISLCGFGLDPSAQPTVRADDRLLWNRLSQALMRLDAIRECDIRDLLVLKEVEGIKARIKCVIFELERRGAT